MARYRITNLVRVGYDEEITLEKIPSAIASLFGAKTKTVRFRGNGTVWHEVSTGRRPGTMMEGFLADLVAGHKIRVTPTL